MSLLRTLFDTPGGLFVWDDDVQNLMISEEMKAYTTSLNQKLDARWLNNYSFTIFRIFFKHDVVMISRHFPAYTKTMSYDLHGVRNHQ